MKMWTLGGSWNFRASAQRAPRRIRLGPSGGGRYFAFRLAKPTTTSSNTGEDEQPDNPTTHLECT